ncbi:MAG: alpha-galactosidase, partial [Actinomycetota bacterium]
MIEHACELGGHHVELVWAQVETGQTGDLGHHVARQSSTRIGGRHSIAFRGLTALFGHLGIEWNLVDASEEELETLSEIVALYKRSREL